MNDLDLEMLLGMLLGLLAWPGVLLLCAWVQWVAQ